MRANRLHIWTAGRMEEATTPEPQTCGRPECSSKSSSACPDPSSGRAMGLRATLSHGFGNAGRPRLSAWPRADLDDADRAYDKWAELATVNSIRLRAGVEFGAPHRPVSPCVSEHGEIPIAPRRWQRDRARGMTWVALRLYIGRPVRLRNL
jgi:hypothetical protein